MDNSATTRCSERAKNKMVQILTEDYGNPSSLHNMGKTAEDYIKEAKEQIARTLRCDEKEIVFTSGGTESNNMARSAERWRTSARESISSRHRLNMRRYRRRLPT